MDITKILEELRKEHQQLGEAILSLERLAAGSKRRGTPPAWLATVAPQLQEETTRSIGFSKHKKKSSSRHDE